ncbi:putative DNA damage repair protein [Leishmania major strain Friedlin]|uniref:Putative DNA damage repair protein n=1 Tax=Leishmania major TaxID=5664 RepID=Q4Q268_LEIMA|nr:putative DNA damage repair protein [Leishmania major strain Friedlin]CAG9583521.1 DNA_damage_repair_protein_-_putative [Leishmania major strain Friedlin]CAJ08961.1 putative DNA damage repair protein [Leishmania major strain Friedlin]|eukprot:XP_001686580.1 putative DNA damage repair protein [Leishmania major strain Friedlin]
MTAMSRSVRDQVNSLQHFQQHSRLYFIGQWRTKMEDVFREWFVAHPEWNHGTLEQQRTFVHIDMDAFFCSVQLAKPEYAHLKTKPVGIAAGKYNSDISSCNYVARSYGIHAGMYVNSAKERCPELVTLGYDLEACERVAKTLYQIIFDLFPTGVKMSMEVYSIDEVMLAADTTDYALLQPFCETVRRELFSATGCTASCGIGPNIMLARVATDRGKPNGICVVHAKDVAQTMTSLPLKYIHGAGASTMEKICRALREQGILDERTDAGGVTCGSVQKLKREALQRILGKRQGETFYHLVRGEDGRVVTRTGDPEDQRHLGKRIPNAVGCSMNYAVRPEGVDDVWKIVRQLLEDVCTKLRRTDAVAQGLRVTLLERHPLHPKETQKYMGRGKCVEVHLPIKLPHAMAADEVEAMELEIRKAVAPLLVASRAISDAERAAQLGLSPNEMDLVIWTVAIASLRDIVVEDLRGMTVQATGLRQKQQAPFTRQRLSGQQMTLATGFFNAKRPRTQDVVTVVEPTPAQPPSDTVRGPPADSCLDAATLYLLYAQPWPHRDDATAAQWRCGCESACRQLDYPAVKAYLRCALAKLSEWPEPQEAAGTFQQLLSFANTRLPAPLDFL